jgi:hypothetical protein
VEYLWDEFPIIIDNRKICQHLAKVKIFLLSFLSLHFSVRKSNLKRLQWGKEAMKKKLLYMKFHFWIAREINALDCNWFITTPATPKMKYHIWHHLCPTGHNTIAITAGLGSIVQNETPVNSLKHSLPAKGLSGCCNCVYLLPFLYFITLDLWDAIKGDRILEGSGSSYQWMLCLGRTSPAFLKQIIYACFSSPKFYGIFSKPSPMEAGEKANKNMSTPTWSQKHCPSKSTCLCCFMCLGMSEE